MSLIWFFTPWMPGSKGSTNPEEEKKKPENCYIYIIPSLLDVLGTIIDTAGLFYVCLLLDDD